jgi:methionyl-tRNA formyltransferase
LNIAFFGLPLAALLLGRDGHAVTFAAICREGAIGTRRLARALGAKNVLVRPDATSDAVYERAKAAEPDLVVSWFWTTRLPPRVLALAPALGVHPSLLPRHRGPDPYFWAIESGDTVTGVTAHLLADDYDTGAVLAQRELAIDPSWSSWRLAKKLDRPSLAVLREVVAAYARGTPPAPVPQDEKLATSAPAPGDELLAIRWSDPVETIVRRVRAASPWPGAFTEVGEELVTVTRVRPTLDYPRALEPGEAAVRTDGVAVVRAEDGAVELLGGRVENDEGKEIEVGVGELADLVGAARR